MTWYLQNCLTFPVMIKYRCVKLPNHRTLGNDIEESVKESILCTFVTRKEDEMI